MLERALLLGIPGFYALIAYKDIHYTATLREGTREIAKNPERYSQLIQRLPGSNIKKEMQPFLDRVGIRKDLMIIEKLNSGFCAAVGTNFFTQGDGIIVVSPNFQNVDKEACYWLTKHEIGHIKNNDLFIRSLVRIVCLVAAAILLSPWMSFIPALFWTWCTGIMADQVSSQLCERRADDFAIAESSAEELKGGRRWALSFKAYYLEQRKTAWDKIQISSTGEHRFALSHPTLSSRLKKIERALHQRNIQIDHREEAGKITQLKNFIAQDEADLKKERRWSLGSLLRGLVS